MLYALAILLPWLAAHAAEPELQVLNATCEAPPCLTQVRGLRIDSLIAPAHADKAATLQGQLAAIETSCPSFAERFVWLACDESPCLMYLWPERQLGSQTWADVTCGDTTVTAASAGKVALVGDARNTLLAVYNVGDKVAREARAPLQERAVAVWLTSPSQQAFDQAIVDSQ